MQKARVLNVFRRCKRDILERVCYEWKDERNGTHFSVELKDSAMNILRRMRIVTALKGGEG